MFAAFSTALSALDANGVAVDVVGNNLANMNTTGYKQSVAYFQDLVSESMNGGQTQVGFGVASPLTIRQFTQGAISASSGPLDAAIQGNGFFVVNDNGVPQYTRAGSFQVDLSGNLLTPSGQQVQGWMATARRCQYRRPDRQHHGAGRRPASTTGHQEHDLERQLRLVRRDGFGIRLVRARNGLRFAR